MRQVNLLTSEEALPRQTKELWNHRNASCEFQCWHLVTISKQEILPSIAKFTHLLCSLGAHTVVRRREGSGCEGEAVMQ